MNREPEDRASNPETDLDAVGPHDDVARLLRLAGARQPIPAERNARMKAAARAEWQATVTRRRRGRLGLAAAAAAVAAGIAAALALVVARPTPTFEVIAVVGAATVDGRPIVGGDVLAAGSVIATADNGRVALRLGPGRTLRLDRATLVEVHAVGDLAVRAGAIYIDSTRDERASPPAGRPPRVATPFAEIDEIGTQFEVRVSEGRLDVRLREGVVVVHRDDVAHEVQAGTHLTVNSTGLPTRAAIAPSGPEWDWLTDVAPMPTLEGLTAAEFLHWIARERGLELAFDDAAVAAAAATTRLAGAIPNVPVTQALDVVLPTCRLGYQIDGGILRIAAAESP